MSTPASRQRALILAGQLSAAVMLLLGGMGLAGWFFDQPLVRSIWRGAPEMKFNTALALTLTGSSLLVVSRGTTGARSFARLGALLSLLISVATLLQYLLSADFGVDELIFRDTNLLGTTHPGRMAWHSAVCFLLLSAGTLLVSWNNARAAQWLALAGAFLPVQALIGYFYTTMAILGMTERSGYMAVPTGLALLCGAVALLLHSPQAGIMATLTNATEASVAFRRLLAVCVGVPLLMGWVALHLMRVREHTVEYGVATVTLITMVLLVALTWLNALRLNRAEEALRESESRFRSLADGMPHIVWESDRLGATDYQNRAWTEYSGAKAENASGFSWVNYFHPDDAERVMQAWNQSLGSQGTIPFDVEARLRRHDGVYRWFRITAAPIRDAAGEITKWAGICTDIDEEKRAHEVLEETVKDRTAKLRETVHELETFSYSIAHDMRAPLRAMQGFAAMLEQEQGGQLDAAGRNYLQRIAASAERLSRLIVDILNYSKMVRGEMDLEPVDLQKLIGTIVDSYPNLDASHADIGIDGTLPQVRANEAALTQVISNLLGNAVKFVAPGVRPRVRIFAGKSHTQSAANGRVRICFEDNGIGIPWDSQNRLFNIFTRLNRPGLYEGSGIGLAIVKKAVERMGGSVGVESDTGKGSRFWVELRKAAD